DVVTLWTIAGSILDGDPSDHVPGDDPADVVGLFIILHAFGGGVGSPDDFLEVDVTLAFGNLAATADTGGVYLTETVGDLRLDLVASGQQGVDVPTDVALTTRAGSIVDGRAFRPILPIIIGNNVDLAAIGGGIGSGGSLIFVRTSTGGAGSGRLYATARDSVYIVQIDNELRLLAVRSNTGSVTIAVAGLGSRAPPYDLLLVAPGGGNAIAAGCCTALVQQGHPQAVVPSTTLGPDDQLAGVWAAVDIDLYAQQGIHAPAGTEIVAGRFIRIHGPLGAPGTMTFGGVIGGEFIYCCEGPAPVAGPTTGLTISGTVDNATPVIGAPQTFTYTVRNTGDVPIANVTLHDDFLPAAVGVGILRSGDADSDGLLDPGETWIFEVNRFASTGPFLITATVRGTVAGQPIQASTGVSYTGGPIVAHDVKVAKVYTATGVAPYTGLAADTAATGPVLRVGDTVTWFFVVSFAGDWTRITVTDPGVTGTDVTLVSGDTNHNGDPDDGLAWVYRATATVLAGEQCTNVTISVGVRLDPGGNLTDSASNPGCYTGVADPPTHQPTAAIDVLDRVDGTDAHVAGAALPRTFGAPLQLTYWVSNPGDFDVASVTIVDDRGTPADASDDLVPMYSSGDTNDDGILQPSEVWLYEATAKAPAGTVCATVTVAGATSQGPVTATDAACTTTPGPQHTKLIEVFGGTGDDQVMFDQTFLRAKTRVYGSASSTTAGAPDGADSFFVNELQTMDVAAGHTLTLDGQQGSDLYQVQTTGSQGDRRNYVVNVLDSGTTGLDFLFVAGTDGSNDLFLLRKTTSIRDLKPDQWPDAVRTWAAITSSDSAFIALLHDDLADAIASDPNFDPNVRPQAVQRVNYDAGIDDPGTGLLVYGNGGNDTFAVDGTSAPVWIEGGAGNDFFQFGQVYGSKRDALEGTDHGSLEPEDLFPIVATVRGWLSEGPTNPLRAIGGEGDDTFQVYANHAPLLLDGGPGSNVFTTRAFLLARTTAACTADLYDPACELWWQDEAARIVAPLLPTAWVESLPATVVNASTSGATFGLWLALLLPGERNEPLTDPGSTPGIVGIGISKSVGPSSTGPWTSS
ncbi:MAG: hypothetical protein ABI620_09490, partial [Chloroflexota bacterium]